MYYGFSDITFTDNHDEVTTPLRNLNVHDRVFQRHPSESHNDHIVRRKLEPNSHSAGGSTDNVFVEKFSEDIVKSASTMLSKGFVSGVNKRFFF